jgi:hypothetical protein
MLKGCCGAGLVGVTEGSASILKLGRDVGYFFNDER